MQCHDIGVWKVHTSGGTGTSVVVARRGYRVGDVQVTFWLSPVQRGQLRAVQGSDSAQVTLVRLIAEAYEGVQGGSGGDCGGVGSDVGADCGGSGPVEGGGCADHVGVGVADGGVKELTGAARLAAIVQARSAPVRVSDAYDVVDPVDEIA